MVKTTKLYNSLIWFVSVFVPLVVALLLFTKWSQDKLIFDMRFPNSEPVVILDNLPFIEPLTFLPPIYAVINGLTAILLVVAVYYIKNGKRKGEICGCKLRSKENIQYKKCGKHLKINK